MKYIKRNAMKEKFFYYSVVGYSLFIILGSILYVTWKEIARQRECPCNVGLAKEIAAIYVMANPIHEAQNYHVLISQLRSSYPDLNNKSDLIRCMRVIGKRFLCAGLQSFTEVEVARARINEVGMQVKLPVSISDRTYNDLISGQLDLYHFGEELIWLSSVLPAAVRGDSTLYFNTGTRTRNIIRNWRPCLEGMMMDDPLTNQYINTAFKEYNAEYYSLIEEQMLIFCLMAGY